MSKAPERIWAWETLNCNGKWTIAEGEGVEYVRADRIEELEAKLAKAVRALERIGSGEFSGQMLTSMPPQDAAAYFARITLAGLKGTKR